MICLLGKLNGGVEEPSLARVKVNSEGENYQNVMKLSKTLSFVFIYLLLKMFLSIRCWSSLFFIVKLDIPVLSLLCLLSMSVSR